jgi:NAD(P) transhydrogenase subunit alpha
MVTPQSPLGVGVLRETAPRERRVALVPDGVGRLLEAGCVVRVETMAGAAAWFPDGAYAEAGAIVSGADSVVAESDVLLCVRPPSAEVIAALHPGQLLIGLLQPLTELRLVRALNERGVTAVSLDGLPRTLSRAQTMDALTSQATVAGYRAALLAAEAYGRYFPMMVTAAGTARPAEVLVLGAGVAGLQAMGTARRLGAVVRGYDVRPDSEAEVRSVGASFLELTSVAAAPGEGGYARALTPDEQRALEAELHEHVARHDVVITTAQVPGRRPPVLVGSEAVKSMRAGSVVIDGASSPLGGNVEMSKPGETVVTDNGVTVIGADDLPSTMPAGASSAYSRNGSALLLHLLTAGRPAIDLKDEIQQGVVVTHRGTVVHPAVADMLARAAEEGM